MAFQYKARNPGAWEKRATQQGGDFVGFINDGVKTYTPKKGDNFVRILPPTWEDAEHYGMDVWVHYGIGPDRASVLCLRKMKNQPCPLCEAHSRAEKAGDEDLARELKPTKRVLAWIIDRNDEAQGPLAWAMPWTLDRDFCKVSRDKRTGQLYAVDDPEEGFDISFEKEGDGQTTKYVGVQLSRRSSSVDEQHIEFIVELPLPEVLLWRSYDEVATLFEGSGMERKAAEKEGKPAPRRAPPSSPPAKEPPPPADEADYGDPEPEPDLAPVPRRPGPTKPSASEAAEAPPSAGGGARAAEIRARLAARNK